MEVKTYTLTKVFRTDKDKEGNPLVTKQGKPYQKVSIKTTETGDEYINGFGGKTTDAWVEGAKVDIIVTSEVYNGKTYKKFQVPTKDSLIEGRVSSLEAQVMNLTRMVTALTGTVPNSGVAPQAPSTPSPASMDEPDF